MKITIDGEPYPLQMTFTMDEARLIYRYSKVGLDKLNAPENRGNPDLAAALCHIAIARKHPELSEADVEKRVGEIELAKLEVTEDDAGPPAPGSTPTPNEPDSANATSGPPSPNGSDGFPETIPAPTGVQS